VDVSTAVAAITGGASGIGENGAVVCAGRARRHRDMDAERGQMVADEIKTAGGEVIFVEAHMEREADAFNFIRRTLDQYGRLDILVNNAGMRLYQTVVEASEESWDAILGVNLKGYAFCAKAAIPEMRKTGGGSIVNIASQRAFIAGGNMVQYDATKAAVTGLTRGMALDHAPRASESTPFAQGQFSRAFMPVELPPRASPPRSSSTNSGATRCSSVLEPRARWQTVFCSWPRMSLRL
jgi:NAD(P)-dependent dehydrogenase (short-subunit alcohol dehydrogenase family)